jgi:transposase
VNQLSAADARFLEVSDLLARKPVRLATVAMAKKIARIVWVVLTRGEIYRRAYVPVLAT